MGSFSCNKLSVIKPDSVVQKQFKIGGDQHFTMLVDGLLQFVLNFVESINHQLFFLFGKMQGLVYIIGKKGILMNIPA